MRNKLAHLTLVAASWALSACVTGGSPATKLGGDVMVVERSKEHAPSWVSAPIGRLTEGEGVYRYVEISGRMLDLPLGLKQTQLKALEGSRKVIGSYVREQVMDNGGEGLSAKSQAEMQRILDGAIDEVHGHHAKVADIYFERLKDRNAKGDDSGEFYAVYVLVHFPKDRAGEVYETIGRRFSQSVDPGLKRLGPTVQSLARSADLSH